MTTIISKFEKSSTDDLLLLLKNIKFSIELDEHKIGDEKTKELRNSIKNIEEFGKGRRTDGFSRGLRVCHPEWLNALRFELIQEPEKNKIRMESVEVEKNYHTMLTNFIKVWEETIEPIPA